MSHRAPTKTVFIAQAHVPAKPASMRPKGHKFETAIAGQVMMPQNPLYKCSKKLPMLALSSTSRSFSILCGGISRFSLSFAKNMK